MRYVFIQFICTCIQAVCVCVCVCICIVFVIIELFLLLLPPCHSLKNHCSNRWIFHRLKLKYYPDYAQWWERAISGWSRRGRAGRGQSTRITYYLWLRVPVRVSCSRLCALALSLFGCQCLFNISLLTSCRVCERVCVWVWERVWCLHSFRCLACSSFTLFAFRCWISLKFAPICHNLYFFLPFFFAIFRVFFFYYFWLSYEWQHSRAQRWMALLLLLRRAADELDKQMKKYTKETTRILCSARVACRERERQRGRNK